MNEHESVNDFAEIGGYKKPAVPTCTCDAEGRHKHWCGAHERWNWSSDSVIDTTERNIMNADEIEQRLKDHFGTDHEGLCLAILGCKIVIASMDTAEEAKWKNPNLDDRYEEDLIKLVFQFIEGLLLIEQEAKDRWKTLRNSLN